MQEYQAYQTSKAKKSHFQTVLSGHGKPNPFKGVTTYEEIDKQSFYGREQERNSMVRIINQNTLSLLYSRSGVGKSSLINAGIIPALKKMHSYFPVYIRISDSLIHDEESDYAGAIIQLIKEAADNNGIEIRANLQVLPYPTVTEFIYLSEFSYKTPGTSNTKKDVMPVLLFDQFEEIFSLEFKKLNVKALLNDLTFIIESKIPPRLENVLKRYDREHNDEQLMILKDRLQAPNKWYRFVFSFREEYLPQFESLKEAIPSIFCTNGRFRLEPFNLQTAREVIHSISMESIELDQELCKHLASLISRLETSTLTLTEEVQPFLLSLICKSLYPDLTEPGAKASVKKAVEEEDTGIVDGIIAAYTECVFREVSAKTRKFVEEELITQDEKRTMYALGDIKNAELKKDVRILYHNSDLRFLNRVEYFSNSHVEILHDRLLKPLISSRKKRRKKILGIKLIAMGALVLILSLVGLKFFLNEKKKVDAYNNFFQENNNNFIGNVRSQIATDKMNTAPLFVATVNYLERLGKTPFFSSHSFLGSDPSETLITDFRDSIVSLFKDQLFLHQDAEDLANKFTLDYRFSYKFKEGSGSQAGRIDTLVIYKLTTPGPPVWAKITFVRTMGNDNLNYNDLYSNDWPLAVSPDNSLIAFRNKNHLFFYRLSGNDQLKLRLKNNVLKPYDSLYLSSKRLSYFMFSSNSRFMIFGDENYRPNLFYDRNTHEFVQLNKLLVNVFNKKQNNFFLHDLFIANDGNFRFFLYDGSGYSEDRVRLYIVDLIDKVMHIQKELLVDVKPINDSLQYFTQNDQAFLLNKYTLKTRMLPLGPGQIGNIHLLNKTSRLIIIDKKGGIGFYDYRTLQKQQQFRKNLLPGKNSYDYPIQYKNSFLAPDENTILINYIGNLEIYDLQKDIIVNTYETYRGPLNNAVFNSDQSVTLVDDYGAAVQWFYTLKAPAKREEVETIYKNLKGRIPEYDFNKRHDQVSEDNLYTVDIDSSGIK